MTFGEEPNGNGFDYDADREVPELDFPIIATDTEKALEALHGRAKDDYESWKRAFLNWLYHEGKKPDRGEGFATGTIRKTSYHTGQILRWLWGERGYATELTPEDADKLMRELGRHSNKSCRRVGLEVSTTILSLPRDHPGTGKALGSD